MDSPYKISRCARHRRHRGHAVPRRRLAPGRGTRLAAAARQRAAGRVRRHHGRVHHRQPHVHGGTHRTLHAPSRLGYGASERGDPSRGHAVAARAVVPGNTAVMDGMGRAARWWVSSRARFSGRSWSAPVVTCSRDSSDAPRWTRRCRVSSFWCRKASACAVCSRSLVKTSRRGSQPHFAWRSSASRWPSACWRATWSRRPRRDFQVA